MINDTYDWAKSVDLTELKIEFDEIMNAPTFVVGSGGSFSACHMFSILQQFRGTFSKPITPLELHYLHGIIRGSNVIFLSAGGGNSDILIAYDRAIKNDPKNVWGLCMRKKTKLAALAAKHSISNIIEVEYPAGKDGFLATNSLIAYFTILTRLFGLNSEAKSFGLSTEEEKSLTNFVGRLDDNFTLTVLFAGWAQPVAIDIESKFTEAGLGNVLLSDFRNLGHGRHNWFDKKMKQSAIVALVSPKEEDLANKTLNLLPTTIPKLILSTKQGLSLGTIDLLIKSFYLAEAVGTKEGIDPGRPGVPYYGSKLYNLRYLSLLDNKKQDYKNINAILRKSCKKSLDELKNVEISYWNEQLEKFRERINGARFGALVLDYDGTLCTKQERLGLPSPKVIEALNNFASNGFVIGIVTGRGKSIKQTLIKCIKKKNLNQFIIGYYNGAIIAPLTDEKQPNISTKKPRKSLQLIFDTINAQSLLGIKPDLSLRPLQLTIKKSKEGLWSQEKSISLECISNLQLKDIQVLESGHSIDVIIKPDVSKTNIIKYCVDACKSLKIEEDFICIGDKGRYPGNDYELLKSPFALSVDEVSSDPDTCWNISSVGKRGVDTCLEYLNSVKYKRTYFTLSV